MSCSVWSKTVVVAGLGNVGSRLVRQLITAPELERLVLVDPDTYEPRNLCDQNIRAGDVGMPKVAAMARACAAIRGDVVVTQHAAAIQDVPLGRLRGDALVCCVDSRGARQALNGVAWQLGMPLVDAAVQADGLLARVAVYQPGPGQPCLECRWSVEDYRLLEPVYACAGDDSASSHAAGGATNAPPELGALAAAHQTMALRRVLAGDAGFAGHELFVNAGQHVMLTAHFRANPECRFDHQTFEVLDSRVSARTTVAELLAAHRARGLGVAGHSFVFAAACPRCAELEPIAPTLSRGIALPRCPGCGGARVPAGQSMRETLPLNEQSPDRPLEDYGLRDGDVLILRTPDSHATYIELGRPS